MASRRLMLVVMKDRPGIISYEEGLRSGLTPSHVQRSDDFSGGFFVKVAGMHHLHCLNLVRKALYFNCNCYKNLGTHAFAYNDGILRSPPVLGQVWYNPEHPKAFHDFNAMHKCNNYEAVRKWAEAREEPPP
ncbi:hypothetical protein B0T14DRAFT_571798 [Immersiella caudata]|uniref:Uncharacterized protein n=1 Tax=Immersiella caudata TaxID=314043 RepID=A0AA39WAI0_9PEZI|nr:hypothetical protein B0T14DRAFT_571798 [Immersiella caudata]